MRRSSHQVGHTIKTHIHCATGRAPPSEFAPAFERSLKAGKPALIEIVLDPEALTPRLGLSQIRANALKSKQQAK